MFISPHFGSVFFSKKPGRQVPFLLNYTCITYVKWCFNPNCNIREIRWQAHTYNVHYVRIQHVQNMYFPKTKNNIYWSLADVLGVRSHVHVHQWNFVFIFYLSAVQRKNHAKGGTSTIRYWDDTYIYFSSMHINSGCNIIFFHMTHPYRAMLRGTALNYS
jgi:hypothetical protein